ncbi:hypothetical protein KVE51_00855 [Helicobacter pylori]|nr:hypothetical protein KVE51_00855 [Helicobacter pylori]
MGIEIKNLGFGFDLILKNTQRRSKINIKELTQKTQAIIFKVLLGDLMGLKGVLFQNPLSALKNNFTTE